MKFTSYPIIAVLTLASMSCERRSEQLSGFGKIRSPQGNWKIELLADDPGLRITKLKNDTIYSPANWTCTKDAYVFVDSDERVWAFDGSSRAFIFEKITNDTNASWDLAGYHHPIPSEFLKRLPANLIPKAE